MVVSTVKKMVTLLEREIGVAVVVLEALTRGGKKLFPVIILELPNYVTELHS